MNTIALLLGLAVSAAAPGPPAADSAAARPVLATRGSFFALSVADLDASARWYEEKLGLEVVMRAPAVNRSAAIVLEGGGLIVELVWHDDALPLKQAAPGVKGGQLFVHGLFKAGVLVDDYQGTLERLEARGVPIAIGPFPAGPDQRANFIIRDNAGNYIQVFEN